MPWRPLFVSISCVAICGCNLVFDVEHGMAREPQPTPTEVGGPAIFASKDELLAVKAKVDEGAEPWASAFARFDDDVQIALVTFEPISVVDDGAGADQSDAQLFATSSSTGSCFNGPFGERHDYCAAIHMSSASRDLAIAYAMTGDDAYAARAVELLHHWFVAPDTRMLPSSSNAGPHTAGESAGSAIEIYLTVPAFMYAASFVAGHPHWQTLGATAEAEFRSWVGTFLDLAKADPEADGGGSRYVYYLVALAAAEATLDRPAGVASVLAAWKRYMDSNIGSDGLLTGASMTSTSWFSLKGLALTAQLSTYYDDDLFAHQGQASAPLLQNAYDALAPCATGDVSCPFMDTINGVDLAEGTSAYELTYARYQAPSHLAAIEAHVRPIKDIRILGWTTLTHGNRFDLGLD